MRASAIRRRRSAIPSPTRCRLWSTAASRRSPPSRDRAEGARGRARPAIREYKDRIGDIVNGIVKRVEYGNVVVDLGRGEAIVRRDEMLPRETMRNGDRIRASSTMCAARARGPQIFLSRTHPQFMAKLFAPGSAGDL